MKHIAGLFCALILAVLVVAPARAADQTLSPAQEQEVERIVGEYLKANPEIILEAIRSLQMREQARQEAETQTKLAKFRDELEHDPMSPVGGNPNGDVTVVEFFDYRCQYCKQVAPVVERLLETDDNLRYVFKEFPILGPQSLLATRAALAAWKNDPKKYAAFHSALMKARGELTESTILAIAKQVELDPKVVKTGMNDGEIEDSLRRNLALAEQLGITGTPAFVIGDRLIPGAVDLKTLRQVIAEARKG